MKRLDKKNIVIYKIENIKNGKVYIGYSTSYDVRRDKHLNELRKNKHHSDKLQRSFNKNGEQYFKFEIIEEGIIDIPTAWRLERKYIQEHNSYNNGYNMTTGGEGIHGHFGDKHWNAVKIYSYDLRGNFLKEYPTIKECSVEVYGDSGRLKITDDIYLSKLGYIFTKSKMSKSELCKVHQYDLDGNYIDSFCNKLYAAKEIGGNEQNLTRSIKIKGTYKGYQWRDEYFEKLEPIEISSKETTRRVQGKPIVRYDLETGNILKEYDVVADAVREYGCSISSCLRGITKKAYGFGWKYKN